jgi:hypothetical protein
MAAGERTHPEQRKPSRGTLKIPQPDHPVGEIFRSEFRICDLIVSNSPRQDEFSGAGSRPTRNLDKL